MVPVSFFDLSLFSHGTSLVCFIQVPYHPCCLSSLQSSCFFSLPLSIPFSSLMTELLAGDMKAAFSHRKSILNSQERDQLSEMLNWTLDLSLACLFFLNIHPFSFPISTSPSQTFLPHYSLFQFIAAKIGQMFCKSLLLKTWYWPANAILLFYNGSASLTTVSQYSFNTFYFTWAPREIISAWCGRILLNGL